MCSLHTNDRNCTIYVCTTFMYLIVKSIGFCDHTHKQPRCLSCFWWHRKIFPYTHIQVLVCRESQVYFTGYCMFSCLDRNPSSINNLIRWTASADSCKGCQKDWKELLARLMNMSDWLLFKSKASSGFGVVTKAE